jgi:formate/nitrite transporter FocA (FNT family)
MDYTKPADVVTAMIDASVKKLALAPRDLLIRGALSGALLGAATSLAFGAAATTGQPLVGALIFPVGFVMIVLLGLELVTGSFALVPLATLERKSSWGAVIANWGWVFVGNLHRLWRALGHRPDEHGPGRSGRGGRNDHQGRRDQDGRI